MQSIILETAPRLQIIPVAQAQKNNNKCFQNVRQQCKFNNMYK